MATYYIDGARSEEALVSAVEFLLTCKVPAVDGIVDARSVLVSTDNTISLDMIVCLIINCSIKKLILYYAILPDAYIHFLMLTPRVAVLSDDL